MERPVEVTHRHVHVHPMRLPCSEEEVEVAHDHGHTHTGLTAALLRVSHDPRHRPHRHDAAAMASLEAGYRRIITAGGTS